MKDKQHLAEDVFSPMGIESLGALLPKHSIERVKPPRSQFHRRLKASAVILSIILNIILSYRLLAVDSNIEAGSPNLFWTPFNSRLNYHVRRFTSGFGHQISQWQGPPSPEKDELWRNQYVESFLLPKSEARKLANKTIPISEDPDSEYMTSFSVFHYLHCLDIVRQVTEHLYFPDYYNMSASNNQFTGLDKIEGFEAHGLYSHQHIDHCIDSLRQALTCMPDLGPVVWQWDRKDQRVEVFAETVHTCANWDELLEYAYDREYTGDFVSDKKLEPAGRCDAYDEHCDIRG